MTLPKSTMGREFDSSLKRCLKNWSDRRTPPTQSHQKLLLAVKEFDRQYEGWRNHFLFRYLPKWLHAYLFGNNWIFGATDSYQNFYSVRNGEISSSLMIYLYGVRMTTI